MPPITIEATADEVDSPDELFDLLKELNAIGYSGSIQIATLSSDPNGDMGWRLQAHLAPATPGGVGKAIEAHIGDVKVVMNGAISVLTQAEYTAIYGSSE